MTWYNESRRHSLAAKGIKTGKNKTSVYMASIKKKIKKDEIIEKSEDDARDTAMEWAGGDYDIIEEGHDFSDGYEYLKVPGIKTIIKYKEGS